MGTGRRALARYALTWFRESAGGGTGTRQEKIVPAWEVELPPGTAAPWLASPPPGPESAGSAVKATAPAAPNWPPADAEPITYCAECGQATDGRCVYCHRRVCLDCSKGGHQCPGLDG